jgi:hypothetical protein
MPRGDAGDGGPSPLDAAALPDAGPRGACEGEGGFGPLADWPIPRRALRLAEQGDATFAAALHATTDLDGDERPDLVVTYDAGGTAGDGAWLVHLNDGAGFAASPRRWPVPIRAAHLEQQGDATAARFLWTVRDLDGDLRPDLLVTYDGRTPSERTTWRVHRNDGSGFDPVPLLLRLPFPALRAEEQGDATFAARLHALRDLDGDRRPDLVVTYSDREPRDARSWLVHRGTGAGFEAEPIRWPLPFVARRLSEQGDAAFAVRLHALRDVDGDERPDLVVTYDAGGTGEAAWEVYRNDGRGFEPAPFRWSLPRRALRLEDQGDAGAALALHATPSRDRRGPPWFVVTFDRGGAGDRSWRAHGPTATGFAPRAEPWALPMRALRLHEQGEATFARALHSVLDLDGDGRLDFVVTYDAEGRAGTTRWLVARGCADAAAAPVDGGAGDPGEPR